MDRELLELVRDRALNRCEYCRMPQSAHVLTFPVDHVVARQHGGPTTAENLALSCTRCNSYKGPNAAGFDPASGSLTRLFHPRRDNWTDNFEIVGSQVVGFTAIGRTTVHLLQINHPDYIALRESLIAEGFFQ